MVAIDTPAPSPFQRFKVDGERVLLAIVTVYVVGLCVLPLSLLAAEAFTASEDGALGLLASVWDSRATRSAAWNTLEAGLGATLISVLLGGGMALLVELTDIRRKTLLVFLLILPLLIPPQISALAWLELIGPQSLLRGVILPAHDGIGGNPLYGRNGVIALMGIEHAAIAFLAVRAGLRSLPGELVDAARAAGARPLRIVATIVIPLAWPSILAGAALAFVSAIGNFGIPALLGIPGRYTVLTTLIYQRLNGFGPSILGEVAALSLILALMAAAGLGLQALASGRHAREIVNAGGASGRLSLGRWRPAITAAVWVLIVIIAILPLLALFAGALVPSVGVKLTPETATLANFVYVLTELASTRRAFSNSLFLATAAALATIAVSAPLAWLVIRRRSALVRSLNVMADMPYALPGIVLSIAMILAFLRPLPFIEVSLYNTVWILLIAYMARFMALALRPMLAGMQNLDHALEESAQAAGAGPLRRLATIVLPMLAPAAGTAALLVFLGAFSELTVSALLWSQGSETVGVIVFGLYDEGNSTAAAAVSVVVLAVILTAAGLLTVLGRRLPPGVLPWQG
ncbi:iron ABC transporter permease [Fodinicurvata sp. EGI_FJ10296]|uniref:ABC transporter permease n=1 Tax=Fodinicurvata sp. EGI_FJ10296 TaxID=3231908 RepID=UPI003454CEDA